APSRATRRRDADGGACGPLEHARRPRATVGRGRPGRISNPSRSVDQRVEARRWRERRGECRLYRRRASDRRDQRRQPDLTGLERARWARPARHARARSSVRRRGQYRTPRRRRLRRPCPAAARGALMPIRVLVADDQDMVRAGFAMILDAQHDIEVGGEAEDGERAIAEAARLAPDVIVMDIQMPTLDGIAATRAVLARAQPAPRVLVATTFDIYE